MLLGGFQPITENRCRRYMMCGSSDVNLNHWRCTESAGLTEKVATGVKSEKKRYGEENEEKMMACFLWVQRVLQLSLSMALAMFIRIRVLWKTLHV